MDNQQYSQTKINQDLQKIKEFEEKIRQYKERDVQEYVQRPYKEEAYRVRNPFRGV